MKCYFTLTDSVTQKWMNDRYVNYKFERIKRSLKAAALLNDKIYFKGTDALRSPLTERLFRESKVLFDNQIIVPEVWDERTPLKNKVSELFKDSSKNFIKKNWLLLSISIPFQKK